MSETPRALPHAVLWDMDGTLVDTEPAWIAAEYALVAEHGGTWSDEHAMALVGNPLLVSARYIAEHGGVPLPPEEIVDALQSQVIEEVRRAVPWQPGARELLAELKDAGIPCALVTMSWAPLADVVVDALPEGTFTVVVTGDVVANGKPHPEPYLTAADALGVDPRRCVAIEDSETGITSAEAAGAVAIAVPHVVPVPEAPWRHRAGSLTEVDLALLRSLFDR